MGYRTPNDYPHSCEYCGVLVEAGQGVLLKYSLAQSDESIMLEHLTDRIGHEKCVKDHGSSSDKQALMPC